MEETGKGAGKRGRNIISRTDRGTYIEEKRRIAIKETGGVIDYDLKIGKTLGDASAIYGEAYVLSSHIASLRTDSDDDVRSSGKPASEDKALKAAFKVAPADRKLLARKVLSGEISGEEFVKALNAMEGKKK